MTVSPTAGVRPRTGTAGTGTSIGSPASGQCAAAAGPCSRSTCRAAALNPLCAPRTGACAVACAAFQHMLCPCCSPTLLLLLLPRWQPTGAGTDGQQCPCCP